MSEESKQYYYVYKLFNRDCPEFYIGSTTNMRLRKNRHKYDCNKENGKHYNLKVYHYIRSNGGYDAWQYEILEHIRNSINTKELHGVERKYIEQLKPTLNAQIPNRTRDEWIQDNKEYCINHRAQYYQNNIATIKAKRNEKFECPCGGRYTLINKTKHIKSKKHRAFEQS